jgi:hypothetical protein
MVSFWGREEESGQRIGLNQPTKQLIMRRSIGIYLTIIDTKIYKIIGQKEKYQILVLLKMANIIS